MKASTFSRSTPPTKIDKKPLFGYRAIIWGAINQPSISELLALTSKSDLSITFKLTSEHLSVKGRGNYTSAENNSYIIRDWTKSTLIVKVVQKIGSVIFL